MDMDWTQLGQTMAAPSMQPQMPVTPPMQQMLTPELLAKSFAARGVPPPIMDAAPEPIRMPDNNVGSTGWRQDMDLANNGGNDLGAALTGKPSGMAQGGGATPGAPMNIQSPAPQAPMDAQAAMAKKPELDAFAAALKGVKAPANPELQRLGTPAAPKGHAIKGGDIMALLQALNLGAGASSDYKLPSTLGAAIRK